MSKKTVCFAVADDQDEVDLLDVSVAGSRRGGAVAALLLLGLTTAATLALLAHASRR